MGRRSAIAVSVPAALVALLVGGCAGQSAPGAPNSGSPTASSSSSSSSAVPATTTSSASSASSSAPTTSSAASTTAPVAPTVREAQLSFCAKPCRITGQVHLDHPTYGPSTLVTTLQKPDEPGGYVHGEAHLALFDAGGVVRWRHDEDEWDELAPQAPRPIDGTGTVFVNYNPGRYNGVIPLVPTANGFADFDRSDAEPGFYYAELVDTDHDGTYEIEQFANDCMPDCAGGTITHTYYRRDGRTYVPR